MATSLALRRATTSPLFNRLVNPVRSASVFRSFNTNTQMTTYDDDDRSVEVDRRPDRSVSRRQDAFPSFFSDVFDPFSPPRSVSQLLNMMDQMMNSPFAAAPHAMGAGNPSRRGWDVREDDDALYIKMDMPGLDKENVKVAVEENTLIIKGEGEKESEDEEYRRRYSTRLEIPQNLYKLDGIKAEMKNGVLKVAVPKVKEEERKDVFNVEVE
ncbi:Heat shock 22 kDa protein, mitochondrial [Capsicum annuum]|uniref:Heat shock 22 kDa protein, mitochondrial n=1 Tax=Capsicum annuum TaxID=4072 RepID=A0A2G3AEQ2_CAPAN|nr:Heat shock 22 kDa protein, mitochondrial [Capsicum annuum]KAF3681144.1 Heat shock 22 kDa protein, mitochondrial [Capsicum annuum]PHT92711.1 Heat shock 22 kDa protein, mitochondrial [Capsicum annuum]